MMLYLYPEEWTGARAREVHTLSTCVALARAGRPVTLVTAGGETQLHRQLQDIAGGEVVAGFEAVFLSRRLGPVRSAAVFDFHFRRWLHGRVFKGAMAIHLKAARMLRAAGIPYAFEAHEIFAETTRDRAKAQRRLEVMEGEALGKADVRIATSSALAEALCKRYPLPGDFSIVPNAGLEPVTESLVDPKGPFVYLGSIADWKGLELVLAATREAQAPLRIVGGSEAEWARLSARHDLKHVQWRPRVPVREIPQALAGARAGVISTQLESGSGRYSCPMKLFDYARCGLPVLGTALPSLSDLHLGRWFLPVPQPTVPTWDEALRHFVFDSFAARGALSWSADHTWAARGRALDQIFATHFGPAVAAEK